MAAAAAIYSLAFDLPLLLFPSFPPLPYNLPTTFVGILLWKRNEADMYHTTSERDWWMDVLKNPESPHNDAARYDSFNQPTRLPTNRTITQLIAKEMKKGRDHVMLLVTYVW